MQQRFLAVGCTVSPSLNRFVCVFSHLQYRFALYDENNEKLFDNLSTGGIALGISNHLNYETGLGSIESGVAANMHAQDEIYWSLWLTERMYGIHEIAVPVLIASALVLLLLVIYLARAAGRQPGVEGVTALWQEKLPFDLYLGMVGGGLILLLYLCSEISGDFISGLPFNLMVYLVCAAAGAALMLATWLTFCTRVKLGKWWRNTVTFRALSLCWRLIKWCWRVLCAIGRGVRGIPLVWKTAALLAVICLYDLICAMFRRDTDVYLFLWCFGRAILVAAALCAAFRLKKLQAVGAALAGGDLNAKADTSRMVWDFKRHGENLNDISRGMQLAVDKQLKSERLKTELITNVSHTTLRQNAVIHFGIFSAMPRRRP